MGFALPNAQQTATDKLLYGVAAACHFFVRFLTVHPNANGNGHAARLLLTVFLGRYGYWLQRFPVEPRPADPPYTPAIAAYRAGDPRPLETFVLNCLAK